MRDRWGEKNSCVMGEYTRAINIALCPNKMVFYLLWKNSNGFKQTKCFEFIETST